MMRSLLCLAVVFACGACTGTDVGNPPRGELTQFDTTDCKKGLFEKRLDPTLPWQPAPQTYAGLSCVLWEIEGDMLRVRLTNHRDSCAADLAWKPRLAQQGAALDLVLDNPRCIFAACGNCIYDLAFDVRLSELQQRDEELALRLLGDDCNGEREVHQSLRLPLGSARGSSCTYTFEGFSLFGEAASGARHTQCGDAAPLVPCRSDVCTAVAPDTQLCLAPCQHDDDCQPGEVMTCVEGTCRLRDAQAP